MTARNSLGAAYQQTGKTAAAELACEQAWAEFERVLGPRHPDTLRSRAGLAQLYRRLGRYGDARALLRDTIDRLERILPALRRANRPQSAAHSGQLRGPLRR